LDPNYQSSTFAGPTIPKMPLERKSTSSQMNSPTTTRLSLIQEEEENPILYNMKAINYLFQNAVEKKFQQELKPQYEKDLELFLENDINEINNPKGNWATESYFATLNLKEEQEKLDS